MRCSQRKFPSLNLSSPQLVIRLKIISSWLRPKITSMQFLQILAPICKICTGDIANSAARLGLWFTDDERQWLWLGVTVALASFQCSAAAGCCQAASDSEQTPSHCRAPPHCTKSWWQKRMEDKCASVTILGQRRFIYIKAIISSNNSLVSW